MFRLSNVPRHRLIISCVVHFASCSGSTKETRGTAYVAYEDIYDAKQAADHLSGFNVQNRYLIVLYYNPTRQNKKTNLKDQEERLRAMQVGEQVLILGC